MLLSGCRHHATPQMLSSLQSPSHSYKHFSPFLTDVPPGTDREKPRAHLTGNIFWVCFRRGYGPWTWSFFQCLPKLKCVALKQKPHPLVTRLSQGFSDFFLPWRAKAPLFLGHFLSDSIRSPPSLSFLPSFSHLVIQKWLSSDSESHIIINLVKDECSPELPIYWVHLCSIQDEVIGHLHSARYF